MPPKAARFSARCYCGAHHLDISSAPQISVYCHCSDCKRWTGAPAPAFVAFEVSSVCGLPSPQSHTPGVDRWNCPKCGSPLAASFDYLPDQIYVPLGILDQAPEMAPEMHCHWQNRLGWLALDHDGLPRAGGSARAELTARR